MSSGARATRPRRSGSGRRSCQEARARLRGEPPGVYDRIPPAFAALETAVARDGERPCIESYRRRDVVDLLVPVAPSDEPGAPAGSSPA